jgi:hypothetical protein
MAFVSVQIRLVTPISANHGGLMKATSKRSHRRIQLTISWSNSYYLDWLASLEKLLRRKPRTIQIDIIGTGEISSDTALLIRAALMERSRKTRIITNARSSLQGSSVMIWLLGDHRMIRDDARVFFRPADLPEDAEVDPTADGKLRDSKYRDSFSEIDPEEGDYARVLQVINEFLPVKEFAGRLIGVAVLKQFGLIENERVDGFLTNAFAKNRRDLVFR